MICFFSGALISQNVIQCFSYQSILVSLSAILKGGPLSGTPNTRTVVHFLGRGGICKAAPNGQKWPKLVQRWVKSLKSGQVSPKVAQSGPECPKWCKNGAGANPSWGVVRTYWGRGSQPCTGTCAPVLRPLASGCRQRPGEVRPGRGAAAAGPGPDGGPPGVTRARLRPRPPPPAPHTHTHRRCLRETEPPVRPASAALSVRRHPPQNDRQSAASANRRPGKRGHLGEQATRAASPRPSLLVALGEGQGGGNMHRV